jgi:hypothetical protein
LDDLIREHLPYEIKMLVATYARLVNRRPEDDQFLTNVFVESFCLHARNLLEFFEKGGKSKGVVPQNYARPDYKCLHPRRHSVEINQQISHLIFGGRFATSDGKIGERERLEILETVRTELAHFRQYILDPTWVTDSWEIPPSSVIQARHHTASGSSQALGVTVDLQPTTTSSFSMHSIQFSPSKRT